MFTPRSLTPLIAVGLASCGLLLGEDFDGFCPPDCESSGGNDAGRPGDEGSGGVRGGAETGGRGTEQGGSGAIVDDGGDGSGGANGARGGAGAKGGGVGDGDAGGGAGMGGQIDTGGDDAPDSGSGGSPGGEDDPTGGEEDTVVPFCNSAGFGPAGSGAAAGLGVSLTWAGDAIQAYVSRPGQQIVAANWEPANARGAWGYWVCFDAVPRPNRVSATNLFNLMPEVFVTTTDGQIFVRRQYTTGWGSWWSFDRPRANSRVTDIHVVGGPERRARLYVADAGYVFGRVRTTDDPFAPYGAWQRLGTVDAVTITGGTTDANRQHVFVVDSHGAVLSSADPTGPESEWHALPVDGPVLDLDVGYTPNGALNLYVLEKSGALKRSTLLSGDVWGPWELVKDAKQAPQLATITVLHYSREMTDLVFGIDSAGDVQELRYGAWQGIGVP